MMSIQTSPFRAFTLALALSAAALCAHAQTSMKIYRCVDASGAVTLQNDVACPKGSQQSVRNIGVLPTMPTAPAAAKPAAPAVTTPAAVSMAPQPAPVSSAVRSAPQPLFQCRTWDDRDYLGDTAEPASSCVPVTSVGIDGSSALAAGQTCEMRQDTCVAVPVEQLCATWKKRVDEAEFRWKFGGGRNDERKAEFERISKTYRETTCVSG